MKQYNILLKNARVIDPFNNIDQKKDIAILDKKIAEVSDDIAPNSGEKIFDLSGLIVSPGLIDAHTHCFFTTGMHKAWAGDYSIQPDYYSFKTGVTTMVDTGSSGSYNFSQFKYSVIDRSQTRILVYLNIADYGMSSLAVEQYPERNDHDEFVNVCKSFSEDIIGIKIAHYEKADWNDLDYAQKVQEKVNLPIMVDFGVFKKARPYFELIDKRLRKGDISTHCFRAPVPVLDENLNVYPYLWNAKERGIKFDLGHGKASFLFRNAVPAITQGFYPDSISTDVHGLCINGNAIDMANTMSKIKACSDSISWSEIIKLSTCSPAEYLGRKDLGNLSVGSEADIAVWSIRNGEFGFQDSAGGKLFGSEKLECEMTFRAGEIVWDINARDGSLYNELPELYGLETWREELVRPDEEVK